MQFKYTTNKISFSFFFISEDRNSVRLILFYEKLEWSGDLINTFLSIFANNKYMHIERLEMVEEETIVTYGLILFKI